MTNVKKRRSLVTLLLFVVAALLLLFTTIGGASAALSYFSETYATTIHTEFVKVTLTSGDVIGYFFSGGDWQVGKTYTPVSGSAKGFSVSNDGPIDEYVRITIHRYWFDDHGKLTDLDPSLIQVGIKDGWLRAPQGNDSPETIVLYLASPLASGESAEFLDSITIGQGAATTVRQTTNADGTISNVYAYDGISFGIDVLADVVQGHNAADAIKSAWGVDVSVDDGGTLSLN